MPAFHIIPDSYVIVRERGVWRQTKLFHRDGQLYAGLKGGFVQLRRQGGTTIPNISWDEIDGVRFVENRGAIGAVTAPEYGPGRVLEHHKEAS